MKLLCLIFLTLSLHFFLLTYSQPQNCEPDKFSIEPLINSYYYTTTKYTLDFQGCFPSQFPIKYEISIAENPCIIVDLTARSLRCEFRTQIPSNTNISIVAKYYGQTPVEINFIQAFTKYDTRVEYVTPYSSPLIPGQTRFRVAVNGFAPDAAMSAQLDKIEDSLDIISSVNGFIILQLSETFQVPADASRPYRFTLTDLDKRQDFVDIPNFVAFFQPQLQANKFITRTSPDWIVEGGKAEHTIRIFGNLDNVIKFALYHPFSRDPLYVDKKTRDNQSVTFIIPPFDFTNLDLFPNFQPGKYKTTGDAHIPIYRGPLRYNLFDAQNNIVTSSELVVVVPFGEHADFLPDNQFPSNLAMTPKDDPELALSKVSISVIIENYLPDIPTQLTFGKIAKLTQKIDDDRIELHSVESPGYFYVRPVPNRDNAHSLHFLLPPCNECEFPFMTRVCLVAASDDEAKCLVNIGSLTWLEPQKGDEINLTTFIRTAPSESFFESFNLPISNYHYSFPISEGSYETKRLAYRHVKTKDILNMEWIVNRKHTAIAALPQECAIPGKCREGTYEPILLKKVGEKDTVTTLSTEFSTLKLSINSAPAIRVGLLINTSYKSENSDLIMKQIYDAIAARFPQVANILTLSTGKPIEPTPTPDPKPDPEPEPSETELLLRIFNVVVKSEPEREETDTALLLRAFGAVVDADHLDIDTHSNKHLDKITHSLPPLKEDKDQTMAFFVVRPLSANGLITAEQFITELQKELTVTTSPLFVALPELSSAGHAYTSVFYCALNHKYIEKDDKCEAPPSKQIPTFIIVLIVVAVALATIGCIIFVFRKQTKKLQDQQADETSLLADDANQYQEIN